ncbi:hypothetical protein MKX01_041950 [Papaver californicum]|nr:hypothetical protein MKX01_041950 [Papaver californicum]
MTEAFIRKKPGMVSVKEMPILQDGPPPGGFAPVRYARRIPTKGPSAVAIFLATFTAFSWGMYEVGKGNKIRRLAFSLFGFVCCCLCHWWHLMDVFLKFDLRLAFYKMTELAFLCGCCAFWSHMLLGSSKLFWENVSFAIRWLYHFFKSSMEIYR